MGTPDMGTPDMGTPDMGTPDMGTPDMGTPDMGTPDMGTPNMAPSLDVGHTPDVEGCPHECHHGVRGSLVSGLQKGQGLSELASHRVRLG
jgi:hypothetical protein